MSWPLRTLATFLVFAEISLAQIPEAKDEPYPGTIQLKVDLTNVGQKIFRIRETIPASGGSLTLFYPKWIPGEHGPSGPIDGVTGVVITAGGTRVPWKRDLGDMYALHLEVPTGAKTIDVEFQFISPSWGGMFGTGVAVTSRLLVLEWNQVVLYPAGNYSHQIKVTPSIILPQSWSFATALERAEEANGLITFKTVSLGELVDSPLMAGKNFRRIELTPGAAVPVTLNLVGDRPENLVLPAEQIPHYQALPVQAVALFGARHYSHYDFLFTASDSTAHFGLEHHQSSDDRLGADFFTDDQARIAGANLIPHEYVHSWNGKFRRPASLTTPDFNTRPMKGDLLWVYEGLTQYLGDVLTVRAGLWTPEQFRNALAGTAEQMNHALGRGWRPLQDTADEAQILYNVSRAWSSYRRSVDFYEEGELLWLEVDTILRERSKGARSLDDFVRAFYGVEDGSHEVRTYTADDIVEALNKIEPFDWAPFFKQRLSSTDAAAPLGGIERSGWKLTYTDKATDIFKAAEKVWKRVDLMTSIGLMIDAGGNTGGINDVQWLSPAFEVGLAPGMKLIAVNGVQYSSDLLKEAIVSAKTNPAPIELLVLSGDTFLTFKLNYHGGPKYPVLTRVEGTPDRLSDISKPKTP